MSTKKLLLGILAGAAAGAVIGLLLAPEKGSVTRKNISDKGKDALGSLKEGLSNMVDGVVSKFTSTTNEGFDRLQRTRSTASHLNNPVVAPTL